jgi:hypothetical protein
MSRHERKIKVGAQPFLEQGEEVLAALVARPRGWTQKTAGSFVFGSRQEGRNRAAAEQSGLELTSPMALAVTQRRLLSLSIGSPIGLGIGGTAKELVGAVPISDVDAIEAKRLALGWVVTITVRGGEPIKLEANAAAGARALADAFVQAKAAASGIRTPAA